MPATPLTCLESLVGLAPAALSCFPLPAVTAPATTDWVTASSRTGSAAGGVYVSQLAGLNFQPAKEAATDLWDRLAKARAQAAQYVRQQILQAPKLLQNGQKYATTGTLGKAGNGSAYAGPAALTLTTAYQEAGGYLVTALTLQATAAATDVPVTLDGTLVATLASTNAPAQLLTPPFLIPFDGSPHVLAAALPDGVRPLTGQLFCGGCQGNRPFGLGVARNLVGVTTATPNAGFLLTVREVCTTQAADVLCYAATQNDQLADALAQAVVGMSAYYYLLDLYVTAGYNRYTLLEQKQLPALADRFKAHADETITWLAGPTGLIRLPNPCTSCLPNPWAPKIVNVY